MIDWQEAYTTLMSLCNEKDAEIERLLTSNAELLAVLGHCARAILIEDENGPTDRDALLNDLRNRQNIARAAIEKAEGHE